MIEPVGDLHIDDFCKDTAKTWLLLFRRFPVKTTLYVEDIAGADEPDEFGLHSPRFEAGFSALVWLHESDYIHYSDTVKQELVEDATLTHRAFTFLASVDETFVNAVGATTAQPKDALQRRIDHVKATLNDGTSEELKALVLRYMQESRQFL